MILVSEVNQLHHFCSFRCPLFLIYAVELCLKNLNSLSSIDLIDMDEDINIKPTGRGNLCLRLTLSYSPLYLLTDDK